MTRSSGKWWEIVQKTLSEGMATDDTETCLCVFRSKRNENIIFHGKREVNIILHSSDSLLPIEVKYQSSISKSDFKTLVSFMEGEKINKGILVTRDLLERYEVKGKEIRLIPAWLFLMVIS